MSSTSYLVQHTHTIISPLSPITCTKLWIGAAWPWLSRVAAVLDACMAAASKGGLSLPGCLRLVLEGVGWVGGVDSCWVGASRGCAGCVRDVWKTYRWSLACIVKRFTLVYLICFGFFGKLSEKLRDLIKQFWNGFGSNKSCLNAICSYKAVWNYLCHNKSILYALGSYKTILKSFGV